MTIGDFVTQQLHCSTQHSRTCPLSAVLLSGVALIATALFIANTKAPIDDTPPPIPVERPQPHYEEFVAGTSIENRDIPGLVLGDGSDVILILASIHGNENAGTSIVLRLAELFRERPQLFDGRQLVIMPETNPDGVATNRRFNSNGVDINRNFPATNRVNNRRNGRAGLSEPESVAIFRTLERFLPARIVSLHEPLDCIDYDGPGSDLAAQMAEYCPLPVKKLGGRPGSLGSYAGINLGIPIITFELPKAAANQSDEELWNLYGRALLAAVTFPDPAPELAEVE